jgi:predicted Zn-dependent protease
VLAPRNSPVLADALVFEWLGRPSGRYTLQVEGPGGLVLTLKEISGARVEYPSQAPALQPGLRYTVRLIAGDSQRADRAWFEVLSSEETRQIRESLATLNEELAGSMPPNTLVVLRAGFLADRGLLDEARRELIGALAQSPNEATLHLLLGNVYSQIGLPVEARQSFDEAGRLVGEQSHH